MFSAMISAPDTTGAAYYKNKKNKKACDKKSMDSVNLENAGQKVEKNFQLVTLYSTHSTTKTKIALCII